MDDELFKSTVLLLSKNNFVTSFPRKTTSQLETKHEDGDFKKFPIYFSFVHFEMKFFPFSWSAAALQRIKYGGTCERLDV